MARETKAERLEREAKERMERLAEEVRTYLPRLMALMERASKVNFELEVREGKFVLWDRDERRPTEHFMFPEHTDVAEGKLRDLDFEVGCKEEAVAEAERKFRVKNAALAKLTEEERELLGLSTKR